MTIRFLFYFNLIIYKRCAVRITAVGISAKVQKEGSGSTVQPKLNKVCSGFTPGFGFHLKVIFNFLKIKIHVFVFHLHLMMIFKKNVPKML